ncbi:MAG: ATP-binding protein [Oscillospiraceae bacterium]|jgi:DNA replication protein DnaC|nr:ATP-binding protein [Oscillospiraceae bacterium]
MAYSYTIVQRAMARLQSEKEQNEQSSRARIAAIYEKEPRLGEIERELRRTAAHVLAATFRRQGDPVAAMQQLKKENLALQQERDWILQAEGLEPDDLTVQPICPTCGGTGYVGAVMCECLKELCRQEQKKELTNLFGAESFEKFRLDLYPEQYDNQLKRSPREVMNRTYHDTLSYAQNFTCTSPSLLFVGATGLGKTYLSACIARTVADRGFSVSYAPVGQLMAAFENEKFRPQPDTSCTEEYFSCDLLIIDDLGTEMTTQFTISALYQILNTRLMGAKPTIVSTNLPLGDLSARYSEQIASRLLGAYRLYKFYGDDIRFKVK